MNAIRAIVIIGFIVVLAIPLAFRTDRAVESDASKRELIIITPHNEQIRHEFGRAFDLWHQENFGESVRVIWNSPGGTSEIRKILQSQHAAALRSGMEPDGADLVFGGGSYEFDQFLKPIEVTVDGEVRTTTITKPVQFEQSWLDATYGENRIGDGDLYNEDGYWYGAALSGFGIVYNNDTLAHLGLQPPTVWSDLCQPELRGWIALVNPGQSGSITTTFEIILQRVGWSEGWSTLRRAGANARYFSGASAKPPIDVSQGEAAMGMCIDFYGRYQSQAIRATGGGDRVGYVDPPGLTTIDADPIAILNGVHDLELAKRFVEFVLSEKGQSLWQFQAQGAATERELGPHRYELRRMPVIRSLYEEHFDAFVDQVNPFEMARPIEFPDRNVRAFIAVLFSAMVMDPHHELRDAWSAIVDHPAYPDGTGIVTAADVSDPTLKEMLRLFDAMPEVPGPDEAVYDLTTTEHLAVVKAGWLRDGWADEDLWPHHAVAQDEIRRQFTRFFKDNYRQIVRLAEER